MAKYAECKKEKQDGREMRGEAHLYTRSTPLVEPPFPPPITKNFALQNLSAALMYPPRPYEFLRKRKEGGKKPHTPTKSLP